MPLPTSRTEAPRADFLEPLLTAGRAQELFGDQAEAKRSRLLAAKGPVRDALAATLGGPQARRAGLAYERIVEAGPTELPAEWTAILIRAAGTPRSARENGREGILSPLEAQNAALAYHGLSAAEREALKQLVAGAAPAKGEEAWPAQALILKALAARRTALAGADAAIRGKAMAELGEFARGILGLGFAELMQNTSLLDVDETVDVRGFDPLTLDDRVGAPGDRPLLYTGADNDGLFQRYEMSCGPASIEVILAERDPAYALRRRRSPLELNPAADDDLQTQILGQYGLTPASRVVPAAVIRLRTAMSALERTGQLPSEAARQAAGYLLGAPSSPKGALVDTALAAIRAASDGFPDDATAQQIRAYVPPAAGKAYSTIGFANVAILLNRIVGNSLGIEYKLRSLYSEQGVRVGTDAAAARSSDFVRAHLDLLEQNLADGIDIVLGTTFPDHFWSMSNVKGKAPDRQFLVHDTWSGRTGWVDESRLSDGSFARAFLGERKTSTYIDLLYLVG